MARLSVVVPFLNEEENIPRLYGRLISVVDTLTPLEAELVLVDDGSTDNSADVVTALPASKLAVKLVRLSRNFGSHAALAAGVSAATGDAIVFLSADLQDPPELLKTLLERWHEGFEVVWAARASRDDPWSTKVFSSIYYSLMRRFALPQMPPGGVDLCLVDRGVVESLGNLQERNSNIFCLIMWAGFSQCTVYYHREARESGRSKWSVGKKLKLLVDSFVAFSFFPIRLSSALGILLSILGAVYALYIFIHTLIRHSAPSGWSSLMMVVLLCSGAQLMVLGIVCEYLWRSLEVVRNRPTYIIRDVRLLGEQNALTNTEIGSLIPSPENIAPVGTAADF